MGLEPTTQEYERVKAFRGVDNRAPVIGREWKLICGSMFEPGTLRIRNTVLASTLLLPLSTFCRLHVKKNMGYKDLTAWLWRVLFSEMWRRAVWLRHVLPVLRLEEWAAQARQTVGSRLLQNSTTRHGVTSLNIAIFRYKAWHKRKNIAKSTIWRVFHISWA
jgi:hypothetical protein